MRARPKLRSLLALVWVALLGITTAVLESSINFDLMLYGEQVYGEPVLLQSRNEGLSGASLRSIQVSPTNPSRVLARGRAGVFLSEDRGEHFRALRIDDVGHRDVEVVWTPDGALVALLGNSIFKSSDGRAWSGGWVDHFNLDGFEVTSNGAIWVRQRTQNGPTFHRLEWRDGPVLVAGTMPELPADSTSVLATTPSGTMAPQALELDDGSAWVPSAAGAYYRATEDSEWASRNEGIERPLIVELTPHSTDANRLLVSGAGGRVWTSENRGQRWAFRSGARARGAWRSGPAHACDLRCHTGDGLAHRQQRPSRFRDSS